MSDVSEERSGWRDERISRRHREWGLNCPAVDIDFLMVEYDKAKAVGVVEYKHEDALPLRLAHPNVQAIRDLADRAVVPALIVRYANDFSWWYPTPVNDLAKQLCPEPRSMSEEEWIRLVYRCRGRDLPEALCTRA